MLQKLTCYFITHKHNKTKQKQRNLIDETVKQIRHKTNYKFKKKFMVFRFVYFFTLHRKEEEEEEEKKIPDQCRRCVNEMTLLRIVFQNISTYFFFV